ncbi:NADPH-dependent FMN reductase [Motilibacter deserti]|uniref:NADPH-dependent oxidoreductase n=1 Tax=Motilibacter deserti TaxID=2714956 RepID=A0ABX0GSH4_9ACTN|nr:NAD(P)H-dependent oxidoreductase [Motilibacter deserti]NHC12629.1 NADPH-dependent oxidoreductase [Motilibacter deserti]
MTGVVALVGNPRPASKTAALATAVAAEVSAAQLPGVGRTLEVVDLSALGPAVLDPASAAADRALQRVCAASVLVVATPAYKATFTGLLKSFLDRLPPDGLVGVTAVPVAVAASQEDAATTEAALRALLDVLGAQVVPTSLVLLDAVLREPEGAERVVTAYVRDQLHGPGVRHRAESSA